MYIGCNWSIALKKLIENDVVHVDYIKTGAYGSFKENFQIMKSLCPILLHGLGYNEDIGMKDIKKIDFCAVNNLIQKCKSPHYGFHLSIKNSDMYSGMVQKDVFERMSKNIKIIKEKLQVPLLLENTPDCPKDRNLFDHYPFFTPEQINHVLNENDVLFLLDLTHAKITSLYNNWDVRDYISQLPLNRVDEIHINGSSYDKNGFPEDVHKSMEDEDYRLLEWVLNYANPKIVTLEYNGVQGESNESIINSLENQLKRIQKICV